MESLRSHLVPPNFFKVPAGLFARQCELNQKATDNPGKNASIFSGKEIKFNHLRANYHFEILKDEARNGKIGIIQVEPGAGKIPGVVAVKRDSQTGALIAACDVLMYVYHDKTPNPGQTYADTIFTTARFHNYALNKYPDTDFITVDNCQAGPMSLVSKLLQSARDPDFCLDGIYIAAPFSPWSGKKYNSALRYYGAFSGTVPIRFLSDLMGGNYDGSFNSFMFTLHDLAYNVRKMVRDFESSQDSERWQEAINFSIWFLRYQGLAKKQILGIVENLFINSLLSKGELEVDGYKLDLKKLKGTHVFFGSDSDTVVPLDSLVGILGNYQDTEEIIKQGVTYGICRLKDLGHLAVFQSGKVAKYKLLPIVKNFDSLREKGPGLFEVFPQKDGTLKIEPLDLIALKREFTCSRDNQELHEAMAGYNKMMSEIYESGYGPAIRSFSNPLLTEALKRLSPLRFIRENIFTTKNPTYAAARVIGAYDPGSAWQYLPDAIFNFCMGSYGDMLENFENTRNMMVPFMFEPFFGEFSPLGTYFKSLNS